MSKGNGQGIIFKRCAHGTSATTDAAKLRAWRKCACSWWLRTYQGGEKVWDHFASEAAAKVRQTEIMRAKLTGEDRAALDRKRAEMPFVAWAETWIASPGRNERTRVTYRAALRIITSAIGTKSVRQVADDRAGAKRLIEGRSDTYGTKIRNVMTGALNAARDDGMISTHSLDRIKVAVGTRAKKWEATDQAQRTALAAGMDEYGLAVWCAYYLGLRAGESLGLRKSDFLDTIGPDGAMTVLRLTRQRQGTDTDTLKSRSEDNSERYVPVPEELARMVKDAPVYDESGSLFPAGFNSTMYARVRKARDAAGLPATFTLHSLRHQYVSDLQAAGVSNTQISKVIGHSSTVITDRVYGHQTTEGLAAVLRARKSA